MFSSPPARIFSLLLPVCVSVAIATAQLEAAAFCFGPPRVPLVPVLRKLQTKVKVTQRILLTKQASRHASSLSGSLLLLHRQGAGSAGGEERTRAPLRLAITAVLSTEGSSSTLTRRRAASVLNTSADQAAARPALIMLSGGGKLERRSWKRSEEQMSSSRFFTRLPFARRNI